MKSLNAMSAVSLVLIILFLFGASTNSGSSVPKARVHYTFDAPVIDGNKDKVWLRALDVKMNHYFYTDELDKSDLSATFETLWDETKFYCFVTVKDQNLVSDPDLPTWQNDCVEVYFDGDNSKNDGWYDGNDEQLHFMLWQPPIAWHGNIDPDDIIYAYKETCSGYNLEFSIPFNDLQFEPENKYEFGFEMQIDDNDNGEEREEILFWWSTNNDAYLNPSVFGTAILFGNPYKIEKLPVRYTSKAPVVDGKRDGFWSKGQDAKMDHYLLSNGQDKSDLSATFITLWDDMRFYGFVTVKDQNLVSNPELEPWQNDCVEVYFDGDNSKNYGEYDWNDEQLLFMLWQPPIALHGNINPDNIIYAYEGTCSGYNLEFSIPFNDLQFEPVNSYEFGYEMQIDDNDNGIEREEILHWWSTNDDTWWNPSCFGTAFLFGKPRGLGKEMANRDNIDISKPERFDLLPNYPNPFNPTTNIQYQLPMDATVEISIYNMEGQKICSLVNESTSTGVHSVEWNGRDDFGKAVASGIYLYRMKAADYVITRKLTLIR